MRLLSTAVCLTALFLYLVNATQAQSPSNSAATQATSGASISGTVTDPDGRVVPGAQVTLLHAMTELAERETNAQGQFSFDDLPAGDYTIIARSSGFDQLPENIELQAAEKHVADLHLKLRSEERRVGKECSS